MLATETRPAFAPKIFGLTCPHCGLRSMRALGERVYLCMNPECAGEPGQDLGPFVSMLRVDAIHGAQLLPWQEVVDGDRLRKTDPVAFLRGRRSVTQEDGPPGAASCDLDVGSRNPERVAAGAPDAAAPRGLR